MRYFVIFILVFLVLIINIILDQRAKKQYKEKIFPKNIVYQLDDKIELPYIEEGKDTPKVIYRCHRDKTSIGKYQEVFDKTQKLMPDYKQVLFDDEEIETFIKEKYGDRIYKAYKSINPIYGPAKSDFFRMLVIYLYGGIYLDIKSGPISKKVNDIIENNQGKNLISIGQNFPVGLLPRFHFLAMDGQGYHDWSFVSNTNHNEYAQWFIISNKGNLIIKQMIKQMVTNIENGIKEPKNYEHGFASVLALTGPICYSIVISKYANNKNSKIFYSALDRTLKHHIIDYKSIEKGKHYQSLEDKRVLL